jgi:radical SAM superfamily enzyme YgiQ (UPF0313 family)
MGSLGEMKVLLISANRTEINMRTMPLGLAFVAEAVRRRGHEVEMLDLVQVKDAIAHIERVISRSAPGVIGISIRNIDDQTMRGTDFLYKDDREIVSLVRKLTDRPIVLGGAGYSMFPDAILADSEADLGIEGEGEVAFVRLIEALETGEPPGSIPGVHVRGQGPAKDRNLVRDMADSPLPDPDLMLDVSRIGRDTWVPVQTRRGCPMDCSYCSTASIEGRILRKRAVGDVVEWISRLTRLGVSNLYFVDNTFNLPRSYAMELLRSMTDAGLDVRWRCILYPWRIDEELVAAMARAGCVEVSLGSESADDEVLRRMNKRFRREDVAEASRLLRKYGIQQMGFLMFGAPGETQASVEETLAFADSLSLDSLKISIGIRIYPGPALADEARAEGIITPDDTLLEPRFYITPSLDEEWIRQTVARHAAAHPNWIMG